MTNTPPKPHSQTRLPAGGLSPEGQAAYWARNIRILLSLLLIWFTVSFGFGILLRNWLDQCRLPGHPLPPRLLVRATGLHHHVFVSAGLRLRVPGA